MHRTPLTKDSHALRALTGAIDEALDLIREVPGAAEPGIGGDDAPASLLDQCIKLCAQLEERSEEPIRTIHHLACTGGTLISKCIAAMPNTQLLSEVDPLSPLPRNTNKPRFAPTDMVTLVRQSSRGASRDLIIELFLNNLAVVHSESTLLGQRVVIRDHAHSHYCVGADIPERPTLRSLISQTFPVLSLVTVRHPLDSFLSLQSAGWVHFEPPTFEEYCKRYAAFLRAHQDITIVRYEDFVSAPHDAMRLICDTLKLPFSDQFVDLFSVVRLTGDSGRNGGTIEPRPRRPIDQALLNALNNVPDYDRILTKLGYNDCAW